ncbi:MAG: hypothetical protein GF311_10575, partial [Candidatus Lokiarchaeota archaeon]|nr:hypothetical protein [Candidatus Lokiarchaeota archaeon]
MKIRKTEKGKVVVRLKGGLGNQMFQYAAAYAFAAENNLQLALDTFSGFCRDKIYKRTYSLDGFNILDKNFSYFYCLPFWIENIFKVNTKKSHDNIFIRPWGQIINDSNKEYQPIKANDNIKTYWMDGYWQTENYFSQHKKFIRNKFILKQPHATHFLSIGRKMETANSVAVGVRLY